MAEGQGVPQLVLNLIYSQDGSITSMGVPVEIERSQINSISLSRIFDVSLSCTDKYILLQDLHDLCVTPNKFFIKIITGRF